MKRTNERSNRTPQELLTSGSAFKTLETNYDSSYEPADILKEDIKHPHSMSWWKRFLDVTARSGLRKQDVDFFLVLVEH